MFVVMMVVIVVVEAVDPLIGGFKTRGSSDGLVSDQNWLGPGSATWKGFRTFHGWVVSAVEELTLRGCDVVR